MYQNLDFDILNIPDLPDGNQQLYKPLLPRVPRISKKVLYLRVQCQEPHQDTLNPPKLKYLYIVYISDSKKLSWKPLTVFHRIIF